MRVDAPRQLRVVVFKGRKSWVAQCLEYDIAAQSADLETLPFQLARAILAEIELSRSQGVEPFSKLPPAPERYAALVPGARQEDQRSWRNLLPGFLSGLNVLRAELGTAQA